MKLNYQHGVEYARGHIAGSDAVMCYSPKYGPYARSYVIPHDPRTPEQLVWRQSQANAQAMWSDLPADVRRAWDEHVERFRMTCRFRKGMNAFIDAAQTRLILGEPPLISRPMNQPPFALTQLALEPSSDPREFVFRVNYSPFEDPSLLVNVRVTAATRSAARKPEFKRTRAICGVGPASVAIMPTTGGTITFSGARFPVAIGKRFGVAIKVIRADDGQCSRSTFFDLIRS